LTIDGVTTGGRALNLEADALHSPHNQQIELRAGVRPQGRSDRPPNQPGSSPTTGGARGAART
jgi:hypothetical protein